MFFRNNVSEDLGSVWLILIGLLLFFIQIRFFQIHPLQHHLKFRLVPRMTWLLILVETEHPFNAGVLDPPLFVLKVVDGLALRHHEQPRHVDMVFVVLKQIQLFLLVFRFFIIPFQVLVILNQDIQVFVKNNSRGWVVFQNIVNILRIVIILTRRKFRKKSLVQQKVEVVGF